MNELYEHEKILSLLMEEKKILDTKQGFFYRVMLELFGEVQVEEDQLFSENENKTKTRYVCDHCGIENNKSINQDYEKALEIIKSNDEPLSSRIDSRLRKIQNKVSDTLRENTEGIVPGNNSSTQEQEKMKLIILVACMLVGVYFCLRYIERKKTTSSPRGHHPHSLATPPNPPASRPISVRLCLVVPANETIGLSSNIKIQVSELKKLIDVSSYFFCNTIFDDNKLSLETPSGLIAENSHREMYIKIDINDGKDMIGAKTRYSLKENLKDTARCIIQEIAYLKNLSGLENFVRV